MIRYAYSLCTLLFFLNGVTLAEGKTLGEYMANADYQGLKKAIDSGVDLNKPDKAMGLPPLILACQLSSMGFIEAIVNGGADINARDDSGNTCLHYAAEFGNLEMADYLIGRGANVAIKNNEGKRPIDVEVMDSENREEMVALLTGKKHETDWLFVRQDSARKKFDSDAIKKIEQDSEHISWQISANDLISDFRKGVEVVWVGEIIAAHDATDVFTKEPFLKLICAQHPLINPSIQGIQEPIQVASKPTGMFIVYVGGESIPTGGREALYKMKTPIWVVVKGVSKIAGKSPDSYIGLKGNFATVLDKAAIQEK